jgi:hypothetical protein
VLEAELVLDAELVRLELLDAELVRLELLVELDELTLEVLLDELDSEL